MENYRFLKHKKESSYRYVIIKSNQTTNQLSFFLNIYSFNNVLDSFAVSNRFAMKMEHPLICTRLYSGVKCMKSVYTKGIQEVRKWTTFAECVGRTNLNIFIQNFVRTKIFEQKLFYMTNHFTDCQLE